MHLWCSKYEHDNFFDFKFRVHIKNHGIESFDGFSGAPVFCISKDEKIKIIGIVSVCSIRHDFYGGCRDSAEGGRFCHA